LHFMKNQDVANFIAELERFSNIKIRSQFPDISSSLKMLKDITKLRIEADKATPPVETVTPVDPIKPAEIATPVEKIESIKPTEAVPVAK